MSRKQALSKNPVIYHRRERKGRRVLRPFQSSLWFSDASAYSAYSAVKLKDIVISLDFPIVPENMSFGIIPGQVDTAAAIDKKNTHENRMTDMPHKCTNCEQIFDDGSAAILNGCPNCGWNKFLYVPAKPATDAGEATDNGFAVDARDGEFFTGVTETKSGEPEMEEKEEATSDLEVESIRILEKGSYELNLESLLEREEIIMSVKEDGRYLVHLPSVFEKSRKNK